MERHKDSGRLPCRMQAIEDCALQNGDHRGRVRPFGEAVE